MKNDCRIYELKRKPEGSEPHEDHHTRLVEYDDWMRQEEKKYSQLLAELNKSQWLASSGAEILRNTENDSDRFDESLIQESEETRLNNEEFINECDFTMEEALLRIEQPLKLNADKCSNKNSSQQSIVFQCNLSLHKNIAYSSVAMLDKDIHGDMPESNGINSIPWDSVIIESGRLILCQKKAEIFCSNNNIKNYDISEKQKIVYTFHSECLENGGK